jgi:hypothetical protein
MWRCEDVDQQMWGCEDAEDVDQQMWGCEDVEDIDQQIWGYENAFLLRILRKRSREKRVTSQKTKKSGLPNTKKGNYRSENKKITEKTLSPTAKKKQQKTHK